MTQPTLIWFRQDLRLSDHAALTAAAAKGPVVAVYILDDETPGAWKMGAASRWWLHQSLAALNTKIPLIFRRGRADDVLTQILVETKAGALHFTRDYAPWSGALEQRVKAICDKAGVACHRHGGFLLHEPEAIRNGSGEPYKVYTPYSRACFAAGEPRPLKPVPKFESWSGAVASETLSDWKLLPTKPDWSQGMAQAWQPGESKAQNLLHCFLDEALQNYADGRDRPDKPFTSKLSAHLHFGEISPLQIWHATRLAMARAGGALDRSGEKFLKEVLWREFSYHLLHHFPHFPDQPFKPEYADFPWAHDEEALKTWQQGKTGYPIVDAGMRELWHTGIMHNRVRMIAASFLIKDLLVPWQEGEKWFWDTLVDADIGANSASWQWVAGCGADASPYYRIFNPVLQGQKFDPNGDYVRKWVPELNAVPTEFVHCPWQMPVPPKSYPKPMVEHAAARDKALEAFKKIKKAEH
ncbi:MAG: deoxyribodipyrimidine photo-lyase [Alphaproteobacteria bacterium]|nr:deoxyribodipyrimidine photo-lyase [Alphaproteobacteria bacterium]